MPSMFSKETFSSLNLPNLTDVKMRRYLSHKLTEIFLTASVRYKILPFYTTEMKS